MNIKEAENETSIRKQLFHVAFMEVNHLQDVLINNNLQ